MFPFTWSWTGARSIFLFESKPAHMAQYIFLGSLAEESVLGVYVQTGTILVALLSTFLPFEVD